MRIAEKDENGIQYVHGDLTRSLITKTAENGLATTMSSYLPFGRPATHSGPRYGFGGKETDASGLQYYGARFYASATGRFAAADPVHRDGVSPYVFARNNPLAYADLDGRAEYAIIFGYNEVNPLIQWRITDALAGMRDRLHFSKEDRITIILAYAGKLENHYIDDRYARAGAGWTDLDLIQRQVFGPDWFQRHVGSIAAMPADVVEEERKYLKFFHKSTPTFWFDEDADFVPFAQEWADALSGTGAALRTEFFPIELSPEKASAIFLPMWAARFTEFMTMGHGTTLNENEFSFLGDLAKTSFDTYLSSPRYKNTWLDWSCGSTCRFDPLSEFHPEFRSAEEDYDQLFRHELSVGPMAAEGPAYKRYFE